MTLPEQQSSAVRWLNDKAAVLAALSEVLCQVAVCLRQLVSVGWWAVLLVSTITFALHPHLTPTHVLSFGVWAIEQSHIRPRGKRPEQSTSDGDEA